MINVLEVAKWSSYAHCPYPKCKVNFNKPIIELKGKWGKDLTWKPNAKFLFHYYDTHGFPPEMMVEELTRLIESEMTQEQVDYYNKTLRQELDKRGIK